MDSFLSLVRALLDRKVQFVLIGVAGANYYAHAATVVFTTQDRDLYLPPDPANLEKALEVCGNLGLSLCSGDEPLDTPRNRWLAERIIERRALVRASDGRGLDVDLTLVMAGFEFEPVWGERRVFLVEGVEVPVARLAHIVESKAATGREKDRLFLATHADALRQLLSQND